MANRGLSEQIQTAVQLLREGIPVAIPTETVYGLAASIESEDGIAQVFRLKARPFFDPLIVHIYSMKQLDGLVRGISRSERVLMEELWPGPCTFVLKKTPAVNPLITSGLDTVAVRMPSHPVCREILERLNIPLAAPSANKFGRTSPTEASHVRAEWPESELMVVDAGASEHGLESTVLRVSEEGPLSVVEILRPGIVGAEAIKAVLSRRGFPADVRRVESEASPGSMEHHYMPLIPLIVVPQAWLPLNAARQSQIEQDVAAKITPFHALELSVDSRLAARELYFKLHAAAATNAKAIVYGRNEASSGDYWEAIWDRLSRAATKIY